MDDEELVELKRASEDARYARQKEMRWKAACAEQRVKADESLSEIDRLRAALAEAERERDDARAALEILRNATVPMPAWVCPKCGRSHPMTESGCPCIYDNIKITTGTVSTTQWPDSRFDDERGQAREDDNG